MEYFNGFNIFLDTHSIHLFKENIKSLEVVIEIISKIDIYISSNFTHFNKDNEYIIRKKDLLNLVNNFINTVDKISIYYKYYLVGRLAFINKNNLSDHKQIYELFEPALKFISNISNLRLLLLKNDTNNLKFFFPSNLFELTDYIMTDLFASFLKILKTKNIGFKILLLHLSLAEKNIDIIREDLIQNIFGKLIQDLNKELFIDLVKNMTVFIANSKIKHNLYKSIINSTFTNFIKFKEMLTIQELLSVINNFLILNDQIILNDIMELHSKMNENMLSKFKTDDNLCNLTFSLIAKLHEKKIINPPFIKNFSLFFFLKFKDFSNYLSIFKNKANLTKSLLYLTECNLTEIEKIQIKSKVKSNIENLIKCSDFSRETLLRSLLFLDIIDVEIYVPMLREISNLNFIYMEKSNLYNLSFVVLILKYLTIKENDIKNKELIELVNNIENKLNEIIEPNFLINNNQSFFEKSFVIYLNHFEVTFKKNFIAHRLFWSYSDFYISEKNLIIELDGPQHFFKSSKGFIYNQSTLFKRR